MFLMIWNFRICRISNLYQVSQCERVEMGYVLKVDFFIALAKKKVFCRKFKLGIFLCVIFKLLPVVFLLIIRIFNDLLIFSIPNEWKAAYVNSETRKIIFFPYIKHILMSFLLNKITKCIVCIFWWILFSSHSIY